MTELVVDIPKEKDVKEVDSLIKRGLFEKYYQTQIGSAQIGD